MSTDFKYLYHTFNTPGLIVDNSQSSVENLDYLSSSDSSSGSSNSNLGFSISDSSSGSNLLITSDPSDYQYYTCPPTEPNIEPWTEPRFTYTYPPYDQQPELLKKEVDVLTKKVEKIEKLLEESIEREKMYYEEIKKENIKNNAIDDLEV